VETRCTNTFAVCPLCVAWLCPLQRQRLPKRARPWNIALASHQTLPRKEQFTVKDEIGGCDILAVGRQPTSDRHRELKLAFNLELVLQGIERAAVCETYSKGVRQPSVLSRYDGQLVMESGAIIDILLSREGKGRLRPAVASRDFILHTQWLHFAEGSALARMVTERFVSLALGVAVDTLPEGYRAGKPMKALSGTFSDVLELGIGPKGVFDYLDHHLRNNPYFGGSKFSAADIMMHYVIRGAKLISWINPNDFPAIAHWKQDVERRPAFARANAAATPSGADEYGQPIGVPLPFPGRPSHS